MKLIDKDFIRHVEEDEINLWHQSHCGGFSVYARYVPMNTLLLETRSRLSMLARPQPICPVF